MSDLKTPTPADWELWEPLIRDRYKKDPVRIIRQEMEDNGLRVTVKMLRDRYKKWSINDKNCKNRPRRRVAAASRELATQMALLQSPRIVELEDDESHSAQDLAGPQNEPGLLDQQMRLADLRTGSPHAALVSLDPWTHQILEGLSHWCDARVNFPFSRKEKYSIHGYDVRPIKLVMRELRFAESQQAWRRLADVCSAEMMLLTLRRTCNLLRLLGQFFFNYHRDERLPKKRRFRRECTKSRILQFFCQHTGQTLGPHHPITLLYTYMVQGLPSAPLLDIMDGISQIHSQRQSIIRRRNLDEHQSELSFVMTRGSPSGLQFQFIRIKTVGIDVSTHSEAKNVYSPWS